MNSPFAIRIMVVDDDSFMLKLLGRQLAGLGFAGVSMHTSGRAALDALASPPDLILLDLKMPEMDGIEFVRHLVERGYGGSLVLISGEDERMLQAVSTLVRAHSITLLGYLHKPVQLPALAAMLAQWAPALAPRRRELSASYDVSTLRAAIAGGELVNYYQPKVAVSDSRVVGVETLVRWQHPVDGLVFPDQFIGVAEENGLIDEMTRCVLRGALALLQGWQDTGLNLHVAVNLSMYNLAAPAFVDYVAEQVAQAGVLPGNVVLEVTESRLMADLRIPLEVLARLRLKRFRLSIDDFGTGHSSLAQLRDIPFDELKIDRGFVHRASRDATLRAIFDASMNMARQLGMEAVAEGVEDQDDWDFLRSQRCHLAQGYFIAKPMPSADLPDWIARWQAKRLGAKEGSAA